VFDDKFISRLKELCQLYDKFAGEYPESSYEGFALYYFALHGKDGFKPTYSGIHALDYEEGEEYLNELEKNKKIKKVT